MKKLYHLCMFIFFVSLVALINFSSANEVLSNDSLLRKNLFLPATNCQEIKSFNDFNYCVQKSSITLNSCGPTSDWPCMDELGCLKIDKFTAN
jgi:hypothetical protein